MEAGTDDASALATLKMLEERLHRLEYLLHGTSNEFGVPDPASPPAGRNEAVSARLATLESNLHRLASRHGVVQDVLNLCTKANIIKLKENADQRQDAHYPDLFIPAAGDQPPTTLDISTIASIVIAHASSISETASRLASLQDLPVPPASASAELIALQPRLEKAKKVQETQLHELSELRARSARLVERWLEVGVVGQGEVWAEWEERTRAAERGVRRLEIQGEKPEA
jgi:hypothetical protein